MSLTTVSWATYAFFLRNELLPHPVHGKGSDMLLSWWGSTTLHFLCEGVLMWVSLSAGYIMVDSMHGQQCCWTNATWLINISGVIWRQMYKTKVDSRRALLFLYFCSSRAHMQPSWQHCFGYPVSTDACWKMHNK